MKLNELVDSARETVESAVYGESQDSQEYQQDLADYNEIFELEPEAFEQLDKVPDYGKELARDSYQEAQENVSPEHFEFLDSAKGKNISPEEKKLIMDSVRAIPVTEDKAYHFFAGYPDEEDVEGYSVGVRPVESEESFEDDAEEVMQLVDNKLGHMEKSPEDFDESDYRELGQELFMGVVRTMDGCKAGERGADQYDVDVSLVSDQGESYGVGTQASWFMEEALDRLEDEYGSTATEAVKVGIEDRVEAEAFAHMKANKNKGESLSAQDIEKHLDTGEELNPYDEGLDNLDVEHFFLHDAAVGATVAPETKKQIREGIGTQSPLFSSSTTPKVGYGNEELVDAVNEKLDHLKFGAEGDSVAEYRELGENLFQAMYSVTERMRDNGDLETTRPVESEREKAASKLPWLDQEEDSGYTEFPDAVLAKGVLDKALEKESVEAEQVRDGFMDASRRFHRNRETIWKRARNMDEKNSRVFKDEFL